MASTLTDDTVVAAAPHQLSFSLAGEAVVLHRESGEFYELNELGARIWALVREARPVGAVIEAVLGEYDVAPGEGRRYVLGFLEDLLTHGLLERRSAHEGVGRNGHHPPEK